MEQYSLNELISSANVHFETLNVDKLYATSDGQYFTLENRALLHATPNKLRVFAIVRDPEPSVVGDENGTKAADVDAESEPADEIPAHPVDTHGENVKKEAVKEPEDESDETIEKPEEKHDNAPEQKDESKAAKKPAKTTKKK